MSDFPDYAFILWDDICDIIGDSDKWPTKIKNLFWSRNVTHYNRLILCAFVYVNGLNPEVFMEWSDVVGLCRDTTAVREMETWFQEFETNQKKWRNIYQYNIFNHQYEFLNGEVKYRLKWNNRHP